IVRGKELLSNYCRTKSIVLSDLLKPEFMNVCMVKYGFRDWDSLLAAIGHGGLKEGQIINRLQEEYRKTLKKKITDEKVLETLSEIKENKPAVAKSKSGIMVKGINDVAVRFSKCCSPVPGDEIVGFVTRGRGVSIHRTDCVNVINLPEEDRVRLIDAEWSVPEMEEKKEFYEAEIKIYTTNRMGMLADISKTFTENKIDVTSMNVRTSKQGTATLSVGFQIKSVEHLHTVVKKLRGIEGIIDIERTSG
ncbi:MAG: ACT domain-containing protein, partial [Acetivibrio ethanolgignens]